MGAPTFCVFTLPPDISNVYQELQGRIKNFLKGGGYKFLRKASVPGPGLVLNLPLMMNKGKSNLKGKRKAQRGL